MTSTQEARYDALQDTAVSKSVRIVSTTDIRSGEWGDTISFQLPGRSDTLIAEVLMITDDIITGFLWSGKLLNALGYISLLHRENLTAGFLQVDGDFYEWVPLDTSYQFLVERNNEEYKGCGEYQIEPPDSIGPSYCNFPLEYDTFNTCPALVSVLLVVTPQARDWVENHYGSMDVFEILGTVTVNFAFYNSDIPNKEIRIEWVDLEASDTINLSSYANPNINYDISIVPNLIQDYRENYNADVAILLTNRGYADAAGAVAEIGPISEKAYAVIEAPYFISRYTLAHELGHLFGCRHNWPFDLGNDPEDVCAHGKRWIQTPYPLVYDEIHTINTSWSTIVGIPVDIADDVAYEIEDDSGTYYVKFLNDYRILHYSNPDVYYGPEPTGRDEGYVANNALYIRNEACTVADFFPTQELSVFIVHSSCRDIPFDLHASIMEPDTGLPGVPPYEVYWYWSPTGFFHPGQDSLIGFGETISLDEHPACPVYWVRCLVVSSDNVAVSRIRRIDLSKPDCQCPWSGHKGSTSGIGSNHSVSDKTLKIFPNPSFDSQFTLYEPFAAGNTLRLILSDVSGRAIRSVEVEFDLEGFAHFDAAQLIPGIYFLNLGKGSDFEQTNKLVIIQN